MPSAARYHETTLYILWYLAEYQVELQLSDRLLTMEFIEPVATVWKGISNAKSELLKKKPYKKYVNYRLLGNRNHITNQITFRLDSYVKDIRRVEY